MLEGLGSGPYRTIALQITNYIQTLTPLSSHFFLYTAGALDSTESTSIYCLFEKNNLKIIWSNSVRVNTDTRIGSPTIPMMVSPFQIKVFF